MPTDDDQTAAPVDVSEAEIGAAHTAYLARNLGAASTPAPPEPPAGMAERVSLPELPQPDVCSADYSCLAFSAKQMRDYARSALASLRAEREVPAELVALSEAATPGQWHWWTSNSWLRLGTDARGHDRNGTSYGQDGYIAYPYVSRGDHHPDLCIRNKADQKLLPAAVNYLRTLISAQKEPRNG